MTIEHHASVSTMAAGCLNRSNDRIFEPFFTTRSGKGHGLGLS